MSSLNFYVSSTIPTKNWPKIIQTDSAVGYLIPCSSKRFKFDAVFSLIIFLSLLETSVFPDYSIWKRVFF